MDKLNELSRIINAIQSGGSGFPTVFVTNIYRECHYVVHFFEFNASSLLLHLHRNNEGSTDEKELKRMIALLPRSLCFRNHTGQFPIQNAARNLNSLKYIPLFAEEGKDQVEGRGGLIIEDPSLPRGTMVRNLLQQLVFGRDIPVDSWDQACLEVLRKLKERNNIVRDDIHKFNLLFLACDPDTKLRFEFVFEWSTSDNRKRAVHDIIKRRPEIKHFSTFVEVSLQHTPQDYEFLFEEDDDSVTAFTRAFDTYGKQVFEILANIKESDLLNDQIFPTFIKKVGHKVPEKYIAEFTATFLFNQLDEKLKLTEDRDQTNKRSAASPIVQEHQQKRRRKASHASRKSSILLPQDPQAIEFSSENEWDSLSDLPIPYPV